MKRGLGNHGLGLFFGAIFLVALIGQAIVGHADFNHLQAAHRGDAMGFWRYVTSSDFGADVLENWQSEYLQFTLFILTTVWLLQRGSPESKELDKAGRESGEQQQVGPHAHPRSPAWAKVDGIRRAIYENSLLIVMTVIWIGSWFAQSVTGVTRYNTERLDHHLLPVSWFDYLGRADFWERTLENWQSEFLAV